MQWCEKIHGFVCVIYNMTIQQWEKGNVLCVVAGEKIHSNGAVLGQIEKIHSTGAMRTGNILCAMVGRENSQ